METQAADQIAKALKDLGVRPGGMLLVHSSLSSLGLVPGGALTVIRGLQQAVGIQGTLLLPALSYELVGPPDWVFDVLQTPSNVGTIPETFRTLPGTQRSVHPTHSVCGVGPRATWALGEHHLDETPCGPHSPFHHLPRAEGQVLFLGCGLRPNTSIHAIEETVSAPYLFRETVLCRVVWPDGHITRQPVRRHSFAGCHLRYDRIEALLDRPDEMRSGSVLQTKAYLLDAVPMWRAVTQAMQADPWYFVYRVDT